MVLTSAPPSWSAYTVDGAVPVLAPDLYRINHTKCQADVGYQTIKNSTGFEE